MNSKENLRDISVVKKLADKGYVFDYENFMVCDKDFRALTKAYEDTLASIKALSKTYQETIDKESLKFKIDSLKSDLANISGHLSKQKTKLDEMLYDIPNIPSETSPIGASEKDNAIIRYSGIVTNKTSTPHDALLKNFLDFERATKLSGSRFSLMYGQIATLQRALIQFMLDTHIKSGYTEVYVPYIVDEDSLKGTGQLPKFKEDLYKIEGVSSYLIPTGEVPLTNIYRNEKLNSIPVKLTTHTPCFRSEAGSYGKDVKGLIRQHQFEKVELVELVEADKSYEALENMTSYVVYILDVLGIPCRVVELCTGDLGFSSAKTYDVEVWIPSQDCYREISSISNCTDFQSRRMNIKYDKKLVHTLNGSALAVGRTLVSLVENCHKDGIVKIPNVLHRYTGFKEILL